MPLPEGPKRTGVQSEGSATKAAADKVVVKDSAVADAAKAAEAKAAEAKEKEDAAKEEVVEAQRVRQQAAAKLRQRQQELADKAQQAAVHVDELLVKDVPKDAAHGGATDAATDAAQRHHIPENVQHDTPDHKEDTQTTASFAITAKANKAKAAQLATNAGLEHVEDEVPKKALPPVKAPPHDGEGVLVDGEAGRDARKALETGHPAAKVLVAKCQRMTELTAAQVWCLCVLGAVYMRKCCV